MNHSAWASLRRVIQIIVQWGQQSASIILEASLNYLYLCSLKMSLLASRTSLHLSRQCRYLSSLRSSSSGVFSQGTMGTPFSGWQMQEQGLLSTRITFSGLRLMMRMSFTQTPLHSSKQLSRYSLQLNIYCSGSIYFNTLPAYFSTLPVNATISNILDMFFRKVRAQGLSFMQTRTFWKSESSSGAMSSSMSQSTPSHLASSQMRRVSSMSSRRVFLPVLRGSRGIFTWYSLTSLSSRASNLLMLLQMLKLRLTWSMNLRYKLGSNFLACSFLIRAATSPTQYCRYDILLDWLRAFRLSLDLLLLRQGGLRESPCSLDTSVLEELLTGYLFRCRWLSRSSACLSYWEIVSSSSRSDMDDIYDYPELEAMTIRSNFTGWLAWAWCAHSYSEGCLNILLARLSFASRLLSVSLRLWKLPI